MTWTRHLNGGLLAALAASVLCGCSAESCRPETNSVSPQLAPPRLILPASARAIDSDFSDTSPAALPVAHFQRRDIRRLPSTDSTASPQRVAAQRLLRRLPGIDTFRPTAAPPAHLSSAENAEDQPVRRLPEVEQDEAARSIALLPPVKQDEQSALTRLPAVEQTRPDHATGEFVMEIEEEIVAPEPPPATDAEDIDEPHKQDASSAKLAAATPPLPEFLPAEPRRAQPDRPRPALPETTSPQAKREQFQSQSEATARNDHAPLADSPTDDPPRQSAVAAPRQRPQNRAIKPPQQDPPVADNRPDPRMRQVALEAAKHVRRGMALGQQNAFYSARSEFIQALRLIAQALDTREAGRRHGDALAAGLRAIEEANDFIPRGARTEADLKIGMLVESHHTPVLHGQDVESITALSARQRYYTFAGQQFELAAGGQRAGSMALYGLARVHTALAEQAPQRHAAGRSIAVTLHQAALGAASDNYMAANELGVLLAEFGQYQAARDVLHHAAQLSPQAVTWHNLATVHRRMGQTELAHQAGQKAAQLAAGRQLPSNRAPQVQWVGPHDFSTTTRTAPSAGGADTARTRSSAHPQ